MFGHSVPFEERTHKTCIGGLVSIFVRLLLFAYFLVLLSKLMQADSDSFVNLPT